MPEHLENAIVNNDYHYVDQRLNQFDPVPANSVNEALQTGLMIAGKHNSFDTVNVFLKKSTPVENDDPSFCNVNLADASGWTALHYAAQSGSLKCVKLLTEYKAEIDAKTDKNDTALFLAIKQNLPDIVEFLAANNCQLQTKAFYKKFKHQNEQECTALEVAVQFNFTEIAKCLFFHLDRTRAKAIYPKTQDYSKEKKITALEMAIAENIVEIGRCLLKTKELHKKELSELLVEAAAIGHIQIANELLINGAYVNYRKGNICKSFLFLMLSETAE
jgi:ankyrin repeat protein